MVQTKESKILHCEDCLACYSENFYHVCPPWLKALVAIQKEAKDNIGDGMRL